MPLPCELGRKNERLRRPSDPSGRSFSKRGCLLEIGGETVYSNHTLRRMTGYSEEELDIETLTDIERQNLKNVLSKIAAFQAKLSYDFFGTANL